VPYLSHIKKNRSKLLDDFRVIFATSLGAYKQDLPALLFARLAEHKSHEGRRTKGGMCAQCSMFNVQCSMFAFAFEWESGTFGCILCGAKGPVAIDSLFIHFDSFMDTHERASD